MDSRLRVARGIAKDETQASLEVFRTLKRRGRPDGPPPTISAGCRGIGCRGIGCRGIRCRGIAQAMITVYGFIPEYGGVAADRPLTKSLARTGSICRW